MKTTSFSAPISVLLFSAVFALSIAAFSSPVSADVGNFTFNMSNSTLVGAVANFSISFTFPRSFVYCNISVEFPSKYGVSASKIHNVTALTTGATLTTIGGQANGQNVSFVIDSPTNLTANTSFLTLNVTNIILSKFNTTDTFKIYSAYTLGIDTGCGNRIDGAATTFNFATLSDQMVNVTIGISQVNNVTNARNVSGNTFNVTATAQDQFGNTNESGGFNFGTNNTNVTYFSGLGGGNGTFFTVFNATFNGTATVNVSAVRATAPPSYATGNLWNNTGVNLTVLASVIVGLNFSINSSSIVAGNQLLVSPTGFDLNGNINSSGGFNFVGNASGVNQVGTNGSSGTTPGTFNITRNGTFSFNISAVLNSSAWNSTGPNVTVTSDDIAFINVSYNSTSIVAGQRINLTGTPMDRFGNLNFSGGLNFSLANNTLTGVSYVEGNSSLQGAFNITRNGTFAFNVSARLNRSAWNVSIAQNATVTSANILFVNVTTFSGYPTYSNSTVSQSVNGTFNITALAIDRFGNLNFTGGFNFQGSNHSVASYVSGNATIYGVFNTTQTGTATLTVYSVQDATITNASVTLNSTVHPNVTNVGTSAATINSIAVSWNTVENSTTLVEYGADAKYGTNASYSELLTVHNLTIKGLLAGTIYHYRVHVCSAFNLCSFGDDGKFQTNNVPPASGSGAAGAGAGAVGKGEENVSSGKEALPANQSQNSTSLALASTVNCANGTIDATVTSQAGPVQRAAVSMRLPNDTFVLQLTDKNGFASFPINPSAFGTYTLLAVKPGFEGAVYNQPFTASTCQAATPNLQLNGKIYCPNIFQVEALYWGNNPVRGARVRVQRAEFGRVGALPGKRDVSTSETGDSGLVNLTLQGPRVGIYEYTVSATADGFLPSDELVVAYEAGRNDCVEQRATRPASGQQQQEIIRPVSSNVADVVRQAVPVELPKGQTADSAIFVISAVVVLAVAAGLYRLVAEILSLQGPPGNGAR